MFSFFRSPAAMRLVSSMWPCKSPACSRAIRSRTRRTSSTAVSSGFGCGSIIVVVDYKQIRRDYLRRYYFKPCADHRKVGSLIRICQVLLIPGEQVINPVDRRDRHVNRVALNGRCRHHPLINESLGQCMNFGIDFKGPKASQHREGRIANHVRKIRRGKLADNFIRNENLEFPCLRFPPTLTGQASSDIDWALANRDTLAEEACFGVNGRHGEILTCRAFVTTAPSAEQHHFYDHFFSLSCHSE
jgi:hypothetical protein